MHTRPLVVNVCEPRPGLTDIPAPRASLCEAACSCIWRAADMPFLLSTCAGRVGDIQCFTPVARGNGFAARSWGGGVSKRPRFVSFFWPHAPQCKSPGFCIGCAAGVSFLHPLRVAILSSRARGGSCGASAGVRRFLISALAAVQGIRFFTRRFLAIPFLHPTCATRGGGHSVSCVLHPSCVEAG